MSEFEKRSEENEKLNSANERAEVFDEFDPGKAQEAIDKALREKGEKRDAAVADLLARIEKLKTAEVPEGKFKLPEECIDDELSAIEIKDGMTEEEIRRAGRAIGRLEGLDGSVDKEIGEKLWSLYSDPDISLGIHGTVVEADSNLGSEESPFFTDGLGFAYGDLRRTVAFQDRGRIHGHGEVSFCGLLEYDYPSVFDKKPLTKEKRVVKSETVDYGTHSKVRSYMATEAVPARQLSVIVAIPANVDTRDAALRGDETKIIKQSISPGDERRANTLRGEFIVGVVWDSDPNTAVWNPNFDESNVKEFGEQRVAELREEKKRAEEAKVAAVAETAPTKRISLLGKLLARMKK